MSVASGGEGISPRARVYVDLEETVGCGLMVEAFTIYILLSPFITMAAGVLLILRFVP